jgi:hypothetical protein
VINHLRRELPHNLGQSDLDGVPVLKGGENQYLLPLKKVVNLPAFPMPSHVKVTVAAVAHGGRTALGSVDLDVLTATDAYWG